METSIFVSEGKLQELSKALDYFATDGMKNDFCVLMERMDAMKADGASFITDEVELKLRIIERKIWLIQANFDALKKQTENYLQFISSVKQKADAISASIFETPNEAASMRNPVSYVQKESQVNNGSFLRSTPNVKIVQSGHECPFCHSKKTNYQNGIFYCEDCGENGV